MGYFDVDEVLAEEYMIKVYSNKKRKEKIEAPIWMLKEGVVTQDGRLDIYKNMNKNEREDLDAEPEFVYFGGGRKSFYLAHVLLLNLEDSIELNEFIRSILNKRSKLIIGEALHLSLTGEPAADREIYKRLDLSERKIFDSMLHGFRSHFKWESEI
eukprot:GHVP01061781.1.p1 GENE.GHVP01061781.1~~GHVP01061781.1.p1  ORF type:complete len:156 (-),score=33.62 GHVP01061781.1:1154-1621(-)